MLLVVVPGWHLLLHGVTHISRGTWSVWQEQRICPDWLLPPGTVPLTASEAQARQGNIQALKEHLLSLVGLESVSEVMERANTMELQGGMLPPRSLDGTDAD